MSVLESLQRDAAYAVRSLRREPTLVAGVVATFALAIGTNAAMLGLVTRLMLAPPPGIQEPERVARIRIERTDADGESFAMTTTSYPVFRALEAMKRGFASVAAVRTDTMMVGRGSDLTPAAVVQASGNYFSVVGATARVGRFFGQADDELPIGNFVVVLSHAYWKRQYDGQRSVIGSSIVIDGQPFTIVGVAPRSFNGDELAPVDLFMPLSAALRTREFGWWTNDRLNLASVLVRIAPDVRPAAAAEMATAAYLGRQTNSALGMRTSIRLDPIVPGKESRSSPQAKIALWLSGVSIIVLLIATANVGTLLLLRAAKRRRDTAVRLALGAAHRDLAQQLMIESLLLALLGAAAGLVLSRWFGGVLRARLLPNVAAGEGFVDTRVLVASMIAATLAGLIAAVSPLLHARHRNISDDLRNGAGSGSSGRFALQNLLVGVQVALCTVLLVGGGLFVRSLQRVQSQDLGFSTAGLLHVTIDYRGRLAGRDRDQAHREAVERVKQLAFVRSASVVQAMPFGNFHVPPISIPGVPESKWLDKQPPYLYGATPQYLSMMRVKAVQGRLFKESDEQGNQLVVLVNESFARAAWPGESAIGKCLRAGHGSGLPAPGDFGATTSGLPCRTVVGVVRDSRARSLRTDGNETHFMQYYVPFTQLPAPPSFVANPSSVSGILVQVTGDEDRAASAVQRVIQSTSVVPAFAHVRTYQDLLDPQLRSWRLGAVLFSVFSALALGIAAVGLFGVVSYLITQRTREIGVRLALGATRARMWRLVVGDALRLVAAGIVLGGVAAIAAGPAVRGMLFQTSPWEPANLGSAILVLVGVTIVAALWPAWRAGRVDPVVTLRSEA